MWRKIGGPVCVCVPDWWTLPCYFLVKRPPVLSFGLSLRGRTQTQTVNWTPMSHAGFKKHVVIRHHQAANLVTCSSLSVLYCTAARRHPHTLWLLHWGQTKIVYCVLRGNFPYTQSLHNEDKHGSNSDSTTTTTDVLVSEGDMVLGMSLSEISTNDPGIKR